MSTSETQFPECCSYCPHRERFSASCGHELRQALLAELATGSDQACPVYDDWRTQEMARLEQGLSTLEL
jgi:hypothetical protein